MSGDTLIDSNQTQKEADGRRPLKTKLQPNTQTHTQKRKAKSKLASPPERPHIKDIRIAEQLRFQSELSIGELTEEERSRITAKQLTQIVEVRAMQPDWTERESYEFCKKYNFNQEIVNQSLSHLFEDARPSHEAEQWHTIQAKRKKANQPKFDGALKTRGPRKEKERAEAKAAPRRQISTDKPEQGDRRNRRVLPPRDRPFRKDDRINRGRFVNQQQTHPEIQSQTTQHRQQTVMPSQPSPPTHNAAALHQQFPPPEQPEKPIQPMTMTIQSSDASPFNIQQQIPQYQQMGGFARPPRVLNSGPKLSAGSNRSLRWKKKMHFPGHTGNSDEEVQQKQELEEHPSSPLPLSIETLTLDYEQDQAVIMEQQSISPHQSVQSMPQPRSPIHMTIQPESDIIAEKPSISPKSQAVDTPAEQVLSPHFQPPTARMPTSRSIETQTEVFAEQETIVPQEPEIHQADSSVPQLPSPQQQSPRSRSPLNIMQQPSPELSQMFVPGTNSSAPHVRANAPIHQTRPYPGLPAHQMFDKSGGSVGDSNSFNSVVPPYGYSQNAAQYNSRTGAPLPAHSVIPMNPSYMMSNTTSPPYMQMYDTNEQQQMQRLYDYYNMQQISFNRGQQPGPVRNNHRKQRSEQMPAKPEQQKADTTKFQPSTERDAKARKQQKMSSHNPVSNHQPSTQTNQQAQPYPANYMPYSNQMYYPTQYPLQFFQPNTQYTAAPGFNRGGYYQSQPPFPSFTPTTAGYGSNANSSVFEDATPETFGE